MTTIEKIMSRKKDIMREILKLVPDQELAEELFCQTMLKVASALNRKVYQDNGFEFAWAKQIAVFTCIDYFRRQKRKRSVLVDCDDDLMDSKCIEYAENDFISEEHIADQYAYVSRFLELLCEEQREVLILRYYGNLSFKEIAIVSEYSN